MGNAPSSLESMIPSEFRSHGPIFVPSVLIYNTPSFFPIGHNSRSPSKSTMPNTLPLVTTREFPIFHVSAFPFVSPSYIP